MITPVNPPPAPTPAPVPMPTVQGNLHEEPPQGPGVEIGTGYPYALYVHCGIRDARFDGRLWMADPMLSDGSVFFAFGPVYQGESVTPTLPGEPGGEVIRSSATAIEVNGLHVILLLLVPILLTAITLLGLRLQQTTMRKILLWSPAVVLLGFCFVAIASIGMFYLPTALALLVAAIADLGGQEGNEPI